MFLKEKRQVPAVLLLGFCSVTPTSQMLSLSFKQSMISVCIVLSLVIPRWDSILFPVFRGFCFHFIVSYIQWETCIYVLFLQIFFWDEETKDNSCRGWTNRQQEALPRQYNLEWILQAFLKLRFGRGHWMFFSHRKQIFLMCTGEQFTLLRSPVLKCSPELTDMFLHI